MYIFYGLQIMASQIKCGSCGLKSDNISRRIRVWGGSFSGWNILKYPVEVEICVYFKKLYLREKCIKVKDTNTFNNNCGGAR